MENNILSNVSGFGLRLVPDAENKSINKSFIVLMSPLVIGGNSACNQAIKTVT